MLTLVGGPCSSSLYLLYCSFYHRSCSYLQSIRSLTFYLLDYRINHIICTPAPPTGIKDCTWNQILADDSSNSSKHIYAKNLLRTGDTEAKLLSPGGAAIGASSQGGLGDGNFYKMYVRPFDPMQGYSAPTQSSAHTYVLSILTCHHAGTWRSTPTPTRIGSTALTTRLGCDRCSSRSWNIT